MRPINTLVVHCSATRAGQAFTARDIDGWHRQKGWNGIGYHFVIRLDGVVETGRAIATPGAHVEGHNQDTIGICLIGGLDEDGKSADTFNDAQFAALEKQLRALRAKFPKARIRGHRDFPKVAKDCPCFDVRAWCRGRGLDPS